MEVLHARCAGLDVHKDTIVACRRQALNGTVRRELETFGTTTRELLRLSEWLSEKEVTHVVMESTGVFWKPVWNLLCDDFTLTVANPQHVKAVPGRKSDVKDAEWLAELLAHGLVRASFVPDQPIRELRDLTRTHKQLTRERVQHVQRIQKTLQSCNIRLDSAISDIQGAGGSRIVRALARGETDPKQLASLAGKVQASRAELEQALEGRVSDVARVLLRTHLDMIAMLNDQLENLERVIDEALAPFAESVALIETIPGVGRATASVILAEIGVDMSRFPTAAHLVSWAGLCPRLHESAGKPHSRRLRKGDPWLKTALCQVAGAAIKCKAKSYLHNIYFRVRARRGHGKAIMAVAASILTSIHAMLSAHAPYHELGYNHNLERNRQRSIHRLTRRLNELGFEVSLHRAA